MRTATLSVLLGLAFSCFSLATAQDTTEITCYKFTWIAEKNSTSCEDKMDEGIPCFEPFVVTGTGNGDTSNRLPPNITDLVETCEKMNCPSFTCVKDENQCLTWTETDIKGNPQYISRFCGRMADVTKIDDPNAPNTPAITNECFLNKNGTVTVEACACNHLNCNGSSSQVKHLQIFFLTVASAMLVSSWTNRH